ncbi:MAG: signal peptidase I [Clostridia bacterium]|nr:signal peptidase I [Clostridia bacterium]
MTVPEPQKKETFFRSAAFRKMVLTVVCVVVLASLLLNLFTFVMPIVRYYGESMSPTLSDRQILVVSKISEVEPGDIVAFYYNNKVIVRRVVASGNNQVVIDLFGAVSVNGEVLEEPYVESPTLGQCNVDFPYNVPAGAFFVLGDNRAVAMDSRLAEIGPVTPDRLIGKVVYSIAPFGPVR